MIKLDWELDRNAQRRLQRAIGGTPKQIRESFTYAFEQHKGGFLGHLRSAASGRILRKKRKYAGSLSKAIKGEIETQGRGGVITARFYVDDAIPGRAELLDKGGLWPSEPSGYMHIPIYDKLKPRGFINNKKRYPGSFRFYDPEEDKFYTALRSKTERDARGKRKLRILYVDVRQAAQPEPPYKWWSSTVDEHYDKFKDRVNETMKKYFRDNFGKDA